MLRKYIKSIFQQFNRDSNSGKYYIDSDDTIYFAREGKIEKVAETSGIDYLTVSENNIYLYGRLNQKIAGKYLLTSDGPNLSEAYIEDK